MTKYLKYLFLIFLSLAPIAVQAMFFSGAPLFSGWNTLKIGGGGWLVGISTSLDGATLITRPDTYDVYVTCAGDSQWRDMVNTTLLPAYGGSGTAYEAVVAPNDDNRLYVILSTEMYFSTDCGRSWTKYTNFPSVDIYMNSGNAAGWRFDGKRIAADPNNANHVIVTTPSNGVFETTNANVAAATWTAKTTIPPSIPSTSFAFASSTLIPISATGKTTHTITFASTSGVADGYYLWDQTNPTAIVAGATVSSHDAGSITTAADTSAVSASDVILFQAPCSTSSCFGNGGYTVTFDSSSNYYITGWGWHPYYVDHTGTITALAGGPTTSQTTAVGSDGNVWVVSARGDFTSGNSNVWKYTGGTGGSWTQYTAAQTHLAQAGHTVAVDPADPTHVIVADDGGNTIVFNGTTWSSLFIVNVQVTNDVPWLIHGGAYFATGQIAFAGSYLYYSQGVGVWHTPKAISGNITVTSQTAGIEQLVNRGIISTVGVATPILAVADRVSFQNSNLVSYLTAVVGGGQSFEQGFAVDCVYGTTTCFSLGQSNVYKSTDGGFTWVSTPLSPLTPVTTTNAGTSTSSNELHFAAAPQNLYIGQQASDIGYPLVTSAISHAGDSVVHFSSLPYSYPSGGVNIYPINMGVSSSQDWSGSFSGSDVNLTLPTIVDIPAGTGLYMQQANTACCYADPLSGPTQNNFLTVVGFNSTSVFMSGNMGQGAYNGYNKSVVSGEQIQFFSNFYGGSIAASTANNLIVLPQNNSKYPWYTKDGGVTWPNVIICTSCTGFDSAGAAILDQNNFTGWGWASFIYGAIGVAADRVNAGTFYLANARDGSNASPDRGGGFYATIDNGDHWVRTYTQTVPTGGQGTAGAILSAMPGHAGYILSSGGFYLNSQPLYRSVNANCQTTNCMTLVAVPNTKQIISYGYGAPKPGGNGFPSVWVYGQVDTGGGYNLGIYRSDDFDGNTAHTPTWTSVGIHPNGSYDYITAIYGDMNIWGRVYVGFGGSGHAFGQFN